MSRPLLLLACVLAALRALPAALAQEPAAIDPTTAAPAPNGAEPKVPRAELPRTPPAATPIPPLLKPALSAPAAAPRGLEFYYEQVPQEIFDRVSQGFTTVPPMRKEEFLRHVQALRQAAAGSLERGPSLIAARYDLRLADGVLAGTAELEVRAAETPGLLSLVGLKAAVTQAAWKGEPARTVVFGSDQAGKPVVMVAASGTLVLGLSLRAARDSHGGWEVPLALPAAPFTQLTLDLPAGLRPVLAGSRARQEPATPTRWQLEISGPVAAPLRLVSAAAQPPILAQATTYLVSRRGGEVNSRLRLTPRGAWPDELILALDPGLALASVSLGDRPLPVVRDEALASGPAKYRVDLRDLPAGPAELVLRATTDLVTGSDWKLPAARVEGAAWQEESITVSVHSPLSLVDFSASEARLVQAADLVAPASGSLLELRAERPTARVSITLAAREPAWKVESATQISLGASTTRGTQVLSLAGSEGELFEFPAELSPGWVLDTVDAAPPELLDDWELAAGGRLRVSFRQGISDRRPVRLTLRAHRPAAPTQALFGPEMWRICRLDADLPGRRLIALAAEPPLRARLVNDEGLVRLDGQSLAPADAALWAAAPRGLLLVDDPRLTRLACGLDVEPPRFAANVHSELALQEGRLATERHTVTCVPEGTALSRVWVQIAPAAEEEFRWTLGKEHQESLAARRLSVEEQQGLGLSERGEVWEVALAQPHSAAVEIRGERRRPWATALPAPLAAAPFASAQCGRVTIRTPPGGAVQIAARALDPLPLPAPPPGEAASVAGLFRYEPARDVLAALDRSALVAANGELAAAAPVVWSAELETWALPEGEWRHTVTYLLEAGTSERFRCTLPPAGVFRRLWVQGEPAAELPAAGSGSFILTLPPRARFVRIDAEYTTPGQNLARIDPDLAWPKTSGELRRAWSLWLPSAWSLAGEPSAGRSDWAWRLFGSLAREPEESAPSLAAAGGWRSVLPGAASPRDDAAENLLDLIVAAAQARPRTWGDFLRRIDEQLRAAPGGSALWIDPAALKSQEVEPGRALESLPADREQAAVLLEKRGLVLASTRRGWVAIGITRLPPGPELAAGCIRTGGLPAALDSDPALLPAPLWAAGVAPYRLPWAAAPRDLTEPAPAATWTRHDIDLAADAPPSLVTARFEGESGAGPWLLLLAACGLAWALPAACRLPLALAAVAAATLGLLLPTAWSPWCVALWQGLALGLLAAVLWTPAPPPSEEASDSTLSVAPAPHALAGAAVAILLLCLLQAGGHATAQEPAAAPRAKLHRVLVKVDAQGKPADAYVHLTAPFYDELLRASAALRTSASLFVLADARYQVRVAGDAGAGEVESVRVQAVWEIDSLRPDARVSLPFPHRGLALVESGALLDDQPVALDWPEEAADLSLTIATPGRHRLELILRPAVVQNGAWSEISFAIPPTPRAKAEVQSQPARAAIEIVGALGAVASPAAGNVRADLGGVSRLTARWHGGGEAGECEVEQLGWLRLRPGTAVLEMRWRVRGAALPESLAVACDPRLKRLGAPADTGSDATGPERIEISLAKNGEGEATAAATFLVRGMSGLGHIRPPACTATGLRIATNWLAVSADSSFALDAAAAPPAAVLPAGKFLGRWTLAEPSPGLALDLGALPAGNWHLPVAARAAQSAASLTTALSFGDGRTQLAARLEIETTFGAIHAHRLTVPAALEVRSVVAADPDGNRPCRFTRGEKGTVLVLFPEPMSGQYTLTLLGDLPATKLGAFAWPAVALADSTSRGTTALAYRGRGSLVAADEKAGWRSEPAPSGPPLVAGRFVAVWQASGNAARPPRVTIATNEPRIAVRVLTQLVRSPTSAGAEGWQADSQLEIDVREGQLDELRLEVSPRLAGGMALDPPLPVEVVPRPDENLTRLIVTPANPVRGVLRLRLRLPVPLGLGERPRVPEINVLSAESVERFVAAPPPYDLAPLAGDTRLEPASLPAGILPSIPPAAGGKFYRVASPRMTAAIVRVERAAGTAQVRLADVRATWASSGAAALLAAYDVDPAGLTHCVVALPPGLALAAVQLDGQPAQPAAAGPGRWLLELGPRQLPLRIEVAAKMTVTPLGGEAAARSFAAPVLEMPGEAGRPGEALPVAQTLWTIAAPRTLDAGRMPPGGGQEVSAKRQDVARLAVLATMIDLPGDAVDDYSSSDVAQWYLPWARRVAAGQAALARLRWSGGDWTADDTARQEAFEREQVALAARLNVSGLRNQAAEQLSPAASPTQWWSAIIAEEGPRTRLAFKGSQPSVTLDYGGASGDLSWLWSIAGGLAAFAAVGAIGRGAIEWLPVSGWSLTGVGVGLLWWAFLAPAWLGIAILVAAVAAQLRQPRAAA